MARKPKDVLPGAVKRARKLAYRIGDEVWVRAKVTRVAPNERLPEVTHVTVQMPNGNRETLWINPDDDRTIRPDEA